MKRLSNNIKALLEETPTAYYWAGLLAADGHIAARGRIKLLMKDHRHIRKYARFIGWTGKFGLEHGCLCCCAMNAKVVRQFAKKFSLSHNKTYNPPKKLPSNKPHLNFAFVIGLIDGDGSITYQYGRKDVTLRVKCHGSWAGFLKKLFACLTKTGVFISNPEGYAQAAIYNNTIIQNIKRKAKRLDLPWLKRKWNKINLSHITRGAMAARRVAATKHFLKLGFAKTDIAKKLGISNGGVTNLITRNKIRAYIGRMQGR